MNNNDNGVLGEKKQGEEERKQEEREAGGCEKAGRAEKLGALKNRLLALISTV